MAIFKQKMKLNDVDMVFISFLALMAFLAGWFIFGSVSAIILAVLVLVVGIIRMRHTRSVARLNAKKGLFQQTLFKK